MRLRGLHRRQHPRMLQRDPLHRTIIVANKAPRALNPEESLLLHVSDAGIRGPGLVQGPFKVYTSLQVVRGIGGTKTIFAGKKGSQTVVRVDSKVRSRKSVAVDVVTATDDSVIEINGRVVTVMRALLVAGLGVTAGMTLGGTSNSRVEEA